jgi:hypothetical protein
MKKMLILGSLAFSLLTACGGSSTEVTCANTYWDGTVGTCLPADWKVLDRTLLDQRGAPPEVIVAFQADQPVSGQFPTVTVTREALKDDMASKDYSEASLQSVTTLPGYEEGDQTTVTIDGSDVTLHVFTAQPRPEEPRVRFFQVSVAAQSAGYTYTGAIPLTVPAAVEGQIKLILQNATLVDPNAKKE